jgi:hypothetical protein
LLCAVEASWVWNDVNEIKPNTVITEFDTYLDPSNPGPKEPKCLSTEDDCVNVLQSNDKKKLVTAMAIMEEENGDDGETRMVLHSGHDDGCLVKWSLDDNKQIWSKQIYRNNLDHSVIVVLNTLDCLLEIRLEWLD